MSEKSLITRREFLISGAAGTAGIASAMGAPNRLPDVPPVPSAPFHDGEDTFSRGANHLVLGWKLVAKAKHYDLRFQSVVGEEIRTKLAQGGRFDGLNPNRVYKISVRAVNDDGSSDWSAPLDACTRPPQPVAPLQVLEMVHSGVTLRWDLTSLLKDIDSADKIQVVVGREKIDGSIEPISPPLAISGQFTDGGRKDAATYHLRFQCPIPVAPGGLNLSEWGAGLQARIMVFGQLRTPGLQEAQHKSGTFIRRFYGR